jgi:hypothetical protein
MTYIFADLYPSIVTPYFTIQVGEKKQLVRTGRRLEDNIKMDLQEVG